MELKGKNVAFVGGFGGIGLATCNALITKKLKSLVILDLIENIEGLKALESLDPDCKLEYFKFDVTMELKATQQVVEQLLKKIGHIDILIYGAGICNEAEIELTVQINMLGMIKMISLILPHMDKSKGNKGGMIVNIASVVGLDPFPAVPVYSATKAAMISFTRSLAHSVVYNKTGVSMIAICPGVTKTTIFNDLHTFLNMDPNFTKEIVNVTGQSVDECGGNIVKAIEEGKNDSIWLLDEGNLQLVEPPKYDWNISEINKLLS